MTGADEGGRESVEEPGRPGALPGAPPVGLAEALGDALGPLREFAGLLADEGVVRGLIGPREVERLWERHLLNSLVPAQLVPAASSVLDLGSGAGLPGVVWAIARPDLRVELVEPLLRRVTWLDEVVSRLGLGNVTVTRARGEELRGARAVDVVTARAVAPLERLAGWAVPLLRPGGRLLALKGGTAAQELERAAPALARLGAQSADVLHPVAEWSPQAVTVIEVVAREGGPAARGGPGRRTAARGGRTRRQ